MAVIANANKDPLLAAELARILLDDKDWRNDDFTGWLQQARRQFPFELGGVADEDVERNLRAVANITFDPQSYLTRETVPALVDFGGMPLRNPYYTVFFGHGGHGKEQVDMWFNLQRDAQDLLNDPLLARSKAEWISLARSTLVCELSGVEDALIERNVIALAAGEFDPNQHLNAETIQQHIFYGGTIWENPYYKFFKKDSAILDTWPQGGGGAVLVEVSTWLPVAEIAASLLIDPQIYMDKMQWIATARRLLVCETSGVKDDSIERNLIALATGKFDPKVHLDINTIEQEIATVRGVIQNPYYKVLKGE